MHGVLLRTEQAGETLVSEKKGKGVVYTDKEGKTCMIRCTECGRENWAPAVSSGTCAWCGFDANAEEEKE
jgi:ribosomal protein L37E